MAKQGVSKDMTDGSLMKHVIGFTFPLLFGYIFQNVYSVVDTVIVGRYLGVDALAAVGATGSVNFLIVGFCLGLCSGFAIPVAQMFGAKDPKALKKYAGNAITLAAVFALIITVITSVFCMNILTLMKTPDNIIQMSYNYIFVIFLGIPTIVMYNLLSGFLRSLGDSKNPLYFLIVSSFLNIGLDLIFIIFLNMGILGASLATVISQTVSGILCIILIVRKVDLLHIGRGDLVLQKKYVYNLLRMGFPMGFQYSITAIGSVILQTAVNTLGSVYIAATTAANKLGLFLACPYDALGSTMATYSGQNVGAGKTERLWPGLRAAIITGAVYSALALLIVFVGGKYLLLLFVSAEETEVINNAYLYMFITAAFYLLLLLVNSVRFSIQGMGFSGLAVFAGLAEMVARTLVGIFLVPAFGYIAACFASPVAWVFADAFLIPAYIKCVKKLSRARSL